MAVECFNQITLDQPPADRMAYRTAAMEALTGPDAGAVIEKLYRGVMGRAGINFGKIPDSMGDLTSFVKYKTIVDTLNLLNREMGQDKVNELTEAQNLHDNIIRLRDDFVYGFRTDSQFLKTTYNTMVYALCEILNLCIVIYVDMLKARTAGKPFTYEDYSGLLVVQNVHRFNEMVRTGEWGNTMSMIRGKALLGFDDDGFNLRKFIDEATGVGISAAITKWLADGAIAKRSFKDTIGAPVAWFMKMMKGPAKNKITAAIVGIIAVIMIIRFLVFVFFKGSYALRDILADQEKLLAANMEVNTDNTTTSLEKQQKMCERMSGIRNAIETRILKDDANGRKEASTANATDMSRDNITAVSTAVTDAGVDITFG